MRLRDLISLSTHLSPGKRNAITDVDGVSVGHSTLIAGSAVRTGVTAILPHTGNVFREKVAAGVCSINGFGKAAGFEQIRERGVIETPILLTSTLSVGRASDALIAYMLRENEDIGLTTGTVNPVVGECNDGFLNDQRGRHIDEAAVWQAIDTATNGEVAEGNVGAGTGTSCFQFKGGIGTASRMTSEGITVGALVQTNYGSRREMTMYGVPLGEQLLSDSLPKPGPGSAMMVIATDAPLDARQLSRLARRAPYALGRTGTIGHDGSGDFAIAFSTTNVWFHTPRAAVEMLPRFNETSESMDSLFLAAVEALEEAIWNAVVAAETMTGRDGNTLTALPHADLVRLYNQYHGRIE